MSISLPRIGQIRNLHDPMQERSNFRLQCFPSDGIRSAGSAVQVYPAVRDMLRLKTEHPRHRDSSHLQILKRRNLSKTNRSDHTPTLFTVGYPSNRKWASLTQEFDAESPDFHNDALDTRSRRRSSGPAELSNGNRQVCSRGRQHWSWNLLGRKASSVHGITSTRSCSSPHRTIITSRRSRIRWIGLVTNDLSGCLLMAYGPSRDNLTVEHNNQIANNALGPPRDTPLS